MVRQLSERDITVLVQLHFVRDKEDGWVVPKDLGGTKRSHHSKTLRRLFLGGYVEREAKVEGTRVTYKHRVTPRGTTMVQLWQSKKKLERGTVA